MNPSPPAIPVSIIRQVYICLSWVAISANQVEWIGHGVAARRALFSAVAGRNRTAMYHLRPELHAQGMMMNFRASMRAVTELGDEKRCSCCGEFWPADREFFEPMRSSRDGLTPRCIACIKAKLWQLVRRAPESSHAAY